MRTILRAAPAMLTPPDGRSFRLRRRQGSVGESENFKLMSVMMPSGPMTVGRPETLTTARLPP